MNKYHFVSISVHIDEEMDDGVVSNRSISPGTDFAAQDYKESENPVDAMLDDVRAFIMDKISDEKGRYVLGIDEEEDE